MLRIDLLPKTFAVARFNKFMVAILVVVLGLCAAVWMFRGTQVQSQIDAVAEQIKQVEGPAGEYDSVQGQITSKSGELKPIADKVSFIDQSNDCGLIYWDQYEKVRRYIYPRAQLLGFSIAPPNQCRFSVKVTGTTEYARFLLDLLRCPYLTITSFTPLSGGRSVPSSGEPEPGQWPTAHGKTGPSPTTQAPAARGGPGVPGMGRVGPGAGSMMPGGPGGPGTMGPGGPGMMGPGGGPGMGGPGGMPGMMGAMGGGRGAGGSTNSPDKQDITISVTGSLAASIAAPGPPGGGGGGAPGMGGGMPGMMGGGGGMPGMMGGGGPGMMGGGPGMAGGAKAGPPAGAKAGAAKGGDEEDSGGSKGLKGGIGHGAGGADEE